MLFASIIASAAFAVPVELNHQGRLVDAAGAGLEGSHLLTFRLYDADSGGGMVWNNAMAVDFDNGYYSVQLGQDGLLDSDVLGQYPLWMELQVDSGDPMEPRYAVASVPYSVISEVAESVEGGPVDATEISVNGTQVVDSDGNWVGGGSTGSGGGGSSSVAWSDITGVPSDIADGDDDAQLSEGDVENYIENGTVNLATGSRMGGFDLLTTNTTHEPYWSDIQGMPAGIADGDDDSLDALGCATGEVVGWDGSGWVCTSLAVSSQLSESEVEGYIENGPVALASGSTVGGDGILTAGDLQDPDWGDLQNVPAGFADDLDDDTLGTLACQDGETISWDGSGWACTSISFSDSDTLGDLVCAEGQIAVLSGGSWTCGDVSDADSLAALGCAEGEVAQYSSGAWTCSSLTDSDTLGLLACADGEVPVYSEADGAWACGEASANGELATDNVIGSTDGGQAYDSLDTPEAVPDDNEFGFTSSLYISDSIEITTLSLDLAITHPDMAEVTATLESPAGTTVQLVAASYAGTADFEGNIGWDFAFAEGDLYSFYGEDTVGPWLLKIVDAGAGSTGTLDSWTLHFNEDWDGEIFVGDNVTVQETIAVRGELRVEYGGALVMTNTDGVETLRLEAEEPATVFTTHNYGEKVYVTSSGGGCYDATASCESGDVAISGGCQGGNNDWGLNTKNYPSVSGDVPVGWNCRWSSWQGCYYGTAYAVCMDVTD